MMTSDSDLEKTYDSDLVMTSDSEKKGEAGHGRDSSGRCFFIFGSYLFRLFRSRRRYGERDGWVDLL
jgi:hypothetical protein